MTTYYRFDGMLLVIRGGIVKAYKKQNGDFVGADVPANIDYVIAEERKKANKKRKEDILAAKEELAKKALMKKKPKLIRNQRHILIID
jgi:hypothetical protein